MIKLAICDDEASQLDFLEALVKAWSARQPVELAVETYPSAESFMFHYADDPSYQILLLDIEMGKMSGVELARRIREHNKEIQIVFISGYREYIADGYDVEALHYLLKPVKEVKLFEVLNRALTKLQSNERALIVERDDEFVRVPLYEIRFLEVFRNYVTIHAKGDFSVKTTLSKLESELDERFFRVGRSVIVNLKFISRVTKTDIFLRDGSKIQLARGYYDRIHQAMIEHL